MAQLDFFLAKDDRTLFADLVFKSGCRMIVETNYESQSFTTVSSLDKYEEYATSNVLMFIVHPEIFKHPLEWGAFEKEGSKLFFLRQKYGGPTIDFYSPGMIEKRDKKIGPGFIASHSFFYSGKEKIYPDNFYKELFKTFASFIKKHSKQVKLQKRTYWLGNQAIVLCKEHGYSLVEVGEKNLLELI